MSIYIYIHATLLTMYIIAIMSIYIKTTERDHMKKIRSKKNDLLNYFIHDHKYLSKDYLKSCNKFFKEIEKKQKENNHEKR